LEVRRMNLCTQETRPTDDTRLIPLTKGQFAIVDAADYDHISSLKWHAVVYAHATYAMHNGVMKHGCREKNILMHRLIMNAPDGVEVDHHNGNGLDNTRNNLRFCSSSQNKWNRRKTNKRGFKGVYFHRHSGKWHASISCRKKRYNLGYYNSPEDAAKAYDAAALRLHGEFTRLNFPC